MANQKLEKVVGNEADCPICHTHMFCRELPAKGQYPAKPQWQNQEGGPHYNYDFKTKLTTCNGVIIEDPKNVRVNSPRALGEEVREVPIPFDSVGNRPKISPEVLRQESFSDFEKVYSEGFGKSRKLVESLRTGMKQEDEVLFSLATLLTRKYIDFYIGRNF